MSNKDILQAGESIWSDPVNKLSGRIQVQFEDLNPGLRYAVFLELKNHSFDVLAITNQPQIQAEIFDTSGKPIDNSWVIGSGPNPLFQWAMIPYDAYIGFRIDMQGTGMPTREHREVLLATGGKNWRLKSGQYVLKMIAEFKKDKDGPDNQWNGTLVLPPVDVIVKREMIS